MENENYTYIIIIGILIIYILCEHLIFIPIHLKKYLIQDDASTKYLTLNDASTKYLTLDDASTKYLTLNDAYTASVQYLNKTDADSFYLPIKDPIVQGSISIRDPINSNNTSNYFQTLKAGVNELTISNSTKTGNIKLNLDNDQSVTVGWSK